jgi:hypothetical protein
MALCIAPDKANEVMCFCKWNSRWIIHINIELKAESISVLAQTQVYMASKAFWAGTAYLSGALEFTPGF